MIIRKSPTDGRILFKYTDDSPRTGIACKCRGLIVDKDFNYAIVCRSFDRFFNVGEPEAAKLHGKIRVYEKVDGSICRFYYFRGEWYCASMTVIDTRGTPFYNLVLRALATYGLTWDSFVAGLDPTYCYTFELATQDNIIVVPHEGYRLYYLGQYNLRENREEFAPDPRTDCCRVYNFTSLKEVCAAAQELPDDQEGFVVVDENWNRVKVKGPKYFRLHFLLNNGQPDYLRLSLEGGKEEFLSYFPRYAVGFQELEERFCEIGAYAEQLRENTSYFWNYTRKNFAAMVDVFKPFEFFVFCCYEDHSLTWEKFVKDWNVDEWKKFLKKI